MKRCPNCNELVGDNANTCFNCRYDFVAKRVLTYEEKEKKSKEAEQLRQQERVEQERVQKEYQNNREKNALYEYEVVVLNDTSSGGFDVEKYRQILRTYSETGWRLKTVFANEVGKNSSSFGYGGASSGTNATIDQTILTFERCIRPSRLHSEI